MDKDLELYLGSVEKQLRSMPVSERVDVIKELKSSMEELQQSEALTSQQIVERLGTPKELAAGYLGERLGADNSFSFKKLAMAFSFYGLTSLTGMFVLPCGTVLAGGLMICGVIAPVAGLIDLAGYLFGFDVPFVVMQLGSFTTPPLLVFPLSCIMGVLLFLGGKGLWKAVLCYIRKVSSIRRSMDV